MAVVTLGSYSGTEFAPIDGKQRIAVPSEFRNNVPLNADGQRVLWVGIHERLPCLVAFGQDQFDLLKAEIQEERAEARARGVDFDLDEASRQRFEFTKAYTLDDSGRFLPYFAHRDLTEGSGGQDFTSGACAFVGLGRRFEIWWLPTLANCEEVNPLRRRVAASWEAARAKGRGK